MSDSPAHRPMYVYSLAALALALFLAHAVHAFADDPVRGPAAVESAGVEVIVVAPPATPDLSHLREDLARLREEAEKLQLHVQLDREALLPDRITIRRP